jgi:hypothetical protein
MPDFNLNRHLSRISSHYLLFACLTQLWTCNSWRKSCSLRHNRYSGKRSCFWSLGMKIIVRGTIKSAWHSRGMCAVVCHWVLVMVTGNPGVILHWPIPRPHLHPNPLHRYGYLAGTGTGFIRVRRVRNPWRVVYRGMYLFLMYNKSKYSL